MSAQGKKKTKWIILIIIAALLVAAIGIYMYLAWQRKDTFFQGTVINGQDYSGMTVAQAEDQMEKETEAYQLTLTFRQDKTETLTAEQLGYSYVSKGGFQEVKDSQMPILWITGYFQKRTATVTSEIAIDEDKLKDSLEDLEELQADQMVAPADACLVWSDMSFTIQEEEEGTTIDEDKLFQAVKEAIEAGEEELDLEEAEVYENPSVTRQDAQLNQQLEELNQLVGSSITYTLPSGSQVLDGNTLKGWLVQDDQGNYKKDEEQWNQQIRQYVAAMAETVDTLHKDQSFQTTGAGTVTVPNDVFGWQIDQEAEISQLTTELGQGTVTTREPVYASRAVSTENNGIGTTYVEIDLSRQHMWVYDNGTLRLETDIVSGKMTHDRYTPAGIYQVYNKETSRYLRGPQRADGSYEWNAYVDYWMPFNGAIGMHDAYWQAGRFGGTYYMTGGSRGCINMPADKAEELYGWIAVGTPVITYYSQEMQFID